MLYHLSLQRLIGRHTGERLSANQVKSLDDDAIADKLAEPIRLGGAHGDQKTLLNATSARPRKNRPLSW